MAIITGAGCLPPVKYTIAGGDFLIAGQVRHKQQKILPLNRSIHSIFYYEGNIVRNLQRRYDGITKKPTAKYTIARGDFLIKRLAIRVVAEV